MQGRPREAFRWGASTEKLLNVLKSKQIKAIGKKCRALIDDFSAFEVLGGAGRARYIPFDEYGYGFVLEWNYSDEIWELNVVSAPKPKKRRQGGGSGGAAPGQSPRALPARANRPRKKFLKRNLLVLYKKLRRSRFGQKLSAFVSNNGVMRDLSGIVALWGRLTKPRRRFDLAGAVAEALRPFAENLEQAAIGGVCHEPRLVLSPAAARISARGTVGARPIEREQFRI